MEATLCKERSVFPDDYENNSTTKIQRRIIPPASFASRRLLTASHTHILIEFLIFIILKKIFKTRPIRLIVRKSFYRAMLIVLGVMSKVDFNHSTETIPVSYIALKGLDRVTKQTKTKI